MEKKWKKFERIVAAIHTAESNGAAVAWNEDINGRQFDVVIRFKLGFYDYLTLIECKDYSKPISAEKVDAFVTKSRKASANKSIMVAKSGFQKAAKSVARDENIELYSLREVQGMAQAEFVKEFFSVLVIEPKGFLRADGKKEIRLVPHVSVEAQMANIHLDMMGNRSIGEIMQIFSQQLTAHKIPGVPHFGGDFKRATEEHQWMAITLPTGTNAVYPNGEKHAVSKFGFHYWMQKFETVASPMFDPSVINDLNTKYEYTNELTEEKQIIEAAGLELGIDTVLEIGKFYTQPPLKFSYFVEDIKENLAQIFLVESYQHGSLLQMRFIQDVKFQKAFLEITDGGEILRLQKIYKNRDESKGYDANDVNIYTVEGDSVDKQPILKKYRHG